MTDSANEFFTRFFTESRDALRRYIRRLGSSEDAAEEIVQEAFLRTYEKRDAVQIPRAFLFSTARNLANDRRRHSRAADIGSVGNFDDSRVAKECRSLEDVLIDDEASRIMKQAIDRLPPQCHAALTLKVFHGYSYKEIGATLGLSEKTIEKHIGRGLARTHEYLRARYSEYGDDSEHDGGHDG